MLGGGNGDVETNMITSCLRSDKPTFLISLEREIPMLVKGTDDTVETWSSRGHGFVGERRIGTNRRALEAKRALKVGNNVKKKTKGFVEAESLRDSDKL